MHNLVRLATIALAERQASRPVHSFVRLAVILGLTFLAGGLVAHEYIMSAYDADTYREQVQHPDWISFCLIGGFSLLAGGTLVAFVIRNPVARTGAVALAIIIVLMVLFIPTLC
jgi:hypothetical protein